MEKQSNQHATTGTHSGPSDGFIEERKEILEELFERVESYVRINVEIYKLRAVESAAEITSSILANVLIALVAIILFLFLNIGVAIWLGSLLGTPYHGYFLLCGVYLIVLVFLWIFRKNLFKKSMTEAIIRKFDKD
jgi:uncharacterized membrane protein